METPGGARVTLNALSLRPDGAGVSTYIREVLAAMPEPVKAGLDVVVQSDAATTLPGGVRTVTRPVVSGARRAAISALGIPRASVVHGLDVDLPWLHRGPMVTTIHDMSVFDVPWAYTRGRAAAERRLTGHALRRADTVTAVSRFTAERVLAWSGRAAVVTPLCVPTDMRPPTEVEVQRVKEAYDLPARFVLYVGTVEPRKDIARLADACAAEDVCLIVAGGRLGGPVPFLPAHVRRLGFVPRSDVAALYGAATVVAYPSLYEGFGLPPLEAAACGAVVVSNEVASLKEALGDGVIWAVPGDLTSLRRSVRSALWDVGQREACTAAAAIVVSKSAWSDVSNALLNIYQALT